MATFAALKAQIADDLSRTDLTTQIETAVLDAITFYERRRFYFNEMRSLTFPTVASQEFYTVLDAAGIPTLLEIDGAKITISGNDTYPLSVVMNDELESISQGATIDNGQPDYIAYFNQSVRLYPIPQGIYTVRIWGVKSLTALAAPTDTNAWTTDANDLIRSRAKWDLYTNIIKDFEQATAMNAAEKLALNSLDIASSKRSASGGTIVATQF